MFSEKILNIAAEAEKALAPVFAEIDKIAEINTAKVLESFRKHRVSDAMFGGTTGYGYGDFGRDAMDAIYADVFGAEAGFVRYGMISGTHAISTVLFGLLRPNDIMLAVTGRPYDTLFELATVRTTATVLLPISV